MKKISLISVFPLFLFILFGLSSCQTVRNVHNDAIDMGFLKNKGDGNTNLVFDVNSKTAGVNGSVIYSPAENVLLGAGISAFSYKLFDDNSEYNDLNLVEDVGRLRGYKARANIGYYDNFGQTGKGYFESMLTLAYGSNVLRLVDLYNPDNLIFKYKYDPFSFGLQFGVGRNSDNVSLMGGLKFQRYLFGKQIPVYRNYNDAIITVEGISIFQIFYGMRFGKGPVKGNFQINVSINPNDYNDSVIEPYPGFSFGVTYAFGRKKKDI